MAHAAWRAPSGGRRPANHRPAKHAPAGSPRGAAPCLNDPPSDPVLGYGRAPPAFPRCIGFRFLPEPGANGNMPESILNPPMKDATR